MSDSPIAHIFVVDDHAAARESMADVLRLANYRVTCCGSGQEALHRIDDDCPDLLITDLQMPGMSGLELLRELDRRHSDAQTVMVTAHASVNSAVEAMRYGAYDYIEKPFNADQLEHVVERALQQGEKLTGRAHNPHWAEHTEVMIGRSPAMMQLRREIDRCAPTNVTVLINGESGTGKELVAQSLHLHSQRSTKSIVSVNCAAMSSQLMESELFGHEQGAFTGADTARVGRFELANGGTILLDEVTEIDLSLQAKLLRVLQERAFERVGSSSSQPIDVRVLATTNRNLAEEVSAGRLRQDLYFRLAVVPIQVPPLRQRREDIPLLAEHFLQAAAQRVGVITPLASCAVDLLASYHWPGNVRELENLMTRASVLCGDQPLTADQLRDWLLASESDDQTRPRQINAGISLQEMEQQLIEATLDHFAGHREQAAKALGIGVRTLANKLRSYGYAPRATFEKRRLVG